MSLMVEQRLSAQNPGIIYALAFVLNLMVITSVFHGEEI
jgi:hypothetical protein